jgi:hypothetical protein
MVDHDSGSPENTLSRRAVLATAGSVLASTAGCGGRTTETDYEPTAETYVYVDRDALEAIDSLAVEGEEPWASAYDRLLADADEALSLTPKSVVDDGAPGWDDPHRFGLSDSRHDYRVAITMSEAVRDTGLAFWFTGDSRYARTCIDLIDHWCLDEETRMKPNAESVGGVNIEQWITIPAFWYGASFVRGHPYWTDGSGDREAAFRQWVRDYIASIAPPGYDQQNNIWAWRIQTIAGAGSYLDDDDLFERGLEMWQSGRPWADYNTGDDPRRGPRGSLQLELARDDGFTYQVYGTKALTMTAEIARTHGIDLYGYNAPTDPASGSTLRKIYEFMLPFVTDPSSWKWGTGTDGVTDADRMEIASVYELAYSQWQDPDYLDVVRRYGRPAYDARILGHVTLTHGNRFAYAGSPTPTTSGA